jgi:hypothetical protein
LSLLSIFVDCRKMRCSLTCNFVVLIHAICVSCIICYLPDAPNFVVWWYQRETTNIGIQRKKNEFTSPVLITFKILEKWKYDYLNKGFILNGKGDRWQKENLLIDRIIDECQNMYREYVVYRIRMFIGNYHMTLEYHVILFWSFL